MNTTNPLTNLPETERLIRLPEVMQLTGIGKTTVYAHMKNGTFPKSYRVCTRLSAWRLSEIRTWINERVCGGAV